MISDEDINNIITTIFKETEYNEDTIKKVWVKSIESGVLRIYWSWSKPYSLGTKITITKEYEIYQKSTLVVDNPPPETSVPYPIEFYCTDVNKLELELADPICFDTLKEFIAKPGFIRPESMSISIIAPKIGVVHESE